MSVGSGVLEIIEIVPDHVQNFFDLCSGVIRHDGQWYRVLHVPANFPRLHTDTILELADNDIGCELFPCRILLGSPIAQIQPTDGVLGI